MNTCGIRSVAWPQRLRTRVDAARASTLRPSGSGPWRPTPAVSVMRSAKKNGPHARTLACQSRSFVWRIIRSPRGQRGRRTHRPDGAPRGRDRGGSDGRRCSCPSCRRPSWLQGQRRGRTAPPSGRTSSLRSDPWFRWGSTRNASCHRRRGPRSGCGPDASGRWAVGSLALTLRCGVDEEYQAAGTRTGGSENFCVRSLVRNGGPEATVLPVMSKHHRCVRRGFPDGWVVLGPRRTRHLRG